MAGQVLRGRNEALAAFRAKDGSKKRMHYTYVLESLIKPGEFYRGHTEDLRQRLTDHSAGKCLHSAKFRPWRIKFYAAFEHAILAQRFEKYLKSDSRHAFGKRHLG